MTAGDAATGEAPELSLRALPGVGPARAERLARLGVRNVRDLLLLIPRRLERGEAALPLAAARERLGATVTVRGAVRSTSFLRSGRRRSLLRAVVEDGSGALEVLIFNQPWMRERLPRGAELAARGRVVAVRGGRGVALAAQRLGSAASPLPGAGELEAVYPTVSGLSQRFVAGLCRAAAERHARRLEDPLPERLRAQARVPSLAEAARDLHLPSSPEAFAAARRRAALEPLLALQARLWQRRRARAQGRALRLPVDTRLHAQLAGRFPFELTRGQQEVLAELRADLRRRVPMRRLLQGDVGSGKTALGMYACMAAVAHGTQAAFLAPTELLAEQHLASQQELLARAAVRVELVSGSLPAPQRRARLARLARGELDVVFGTHALLSESVAFARLALAVVDEQHRFGVAQRQRLLDKGRDVHALLMTATPIPRSLALTLYGDLDLSVLRERPPGRGAVQTRWLRGRERGRVLVELLRERLERGERAYWVVPRIDEPAEGEAGAVARHGWLARHPLARFGLELVHGRMPAAERQARLARFRAGEARLLVATTLVEVGVDVPEATVMVVEEAQRLGVAQLHQLRGRVGRGARDALCLLLGSPSAKERLELLEREADGFVLAEEDLRARGMGDLAGERQAGDNLEGLSGLEADLDLLLLARDWIAADPAVRRAYLARAPSAAGI